MKKFFAVLIILVCTPTYPDSEGPNQPTAGTNNGAPGEPWALPTLAFEDDGFYALVTSGSESRSDFLQVSNFGFSIPAGSQIDGVEVMIDRLASTANTVTDRGVLVLNASSGFSPADLASSAFWPTTDSFATYGSDSNLWGMTWTADDVNDPNFSVLIAANIPGSVEARVDAILVTVYYTLNSVPSAAGLQVSPASPNRNDNLTAAYIFIDPEVDPESGSEIRWYKDGVLQPELNDFNTVPAIKTDFNELWHFTLRPSDGFGLGTLMTSGAVQITNDTPSASNVLISPDPPANSQVLMLSYDFIDPDGDAESGSQIVWYKNSVPQPFLADSLTVPDTLTSLGDVWFATVRPSDGLANGNIVSSQTVTVQNIAPVASDLWVNNSPLDNPIPLTAQYIYFDFDGDTESGTRIRWYKNSIHQLDLLDSPTVPTGKLFLGDKWYFTVEPSDGSNFGTVQQSNIIGISATMPVNNTLSLLFLAMALLTFTRTVLQKRYL
jgi:hypothetical protein